MASEHPGDDEAWEAAEDLEEAFRKQKEELEARIPEIKGFGEQQMGLLESQFDIEQGEKRRGLIDTLGQFDSKMGATGLAGSGEIEQRRKSALDTGVGQLRSGLLGLEKGLGDIERQTQSDIWETEGLITSTENQFRQSAATIAPEYDWGRLSGDNDLTLGDNQWLNFGGGGF